MRNLRIDDQTDRVIKHDERFFTGIVRLDI